MEACVMRIRERSYEEKKQRKKQRREDWEVIEA